MKGAAGHLTLEERRRLRAAVLAATASAPLLEPGRFEVKSYALSALLLVAAWALVVSWVVAFSAYGFLIPIVSGHAWLDIFLPPLCNGVVCG